MRPREWLIKGFVSFDIVVANCDGPVPAVNEQVPVIEKAAYDEMKATLAALLDQASGWNWRACEAGTGGEIGWVKPRHATSMVKAMEEAGRVLLKAGMEEVTV